VNNKATNNERMGGIMAKSKMKGVSSITKKGVEYWYARISASTEFLNQISNISALTDFQERELLKACGNQLHQFL
jgi:hypothetical protein